jgi:hypothetical protein
VSYSHYLRRVGSATPPGAYRFARKTCVTAPALKATHSIAITDHVVFLRAFHRSELLPADRAAIADKGRGIIEAARARGEKTPSLAIRLRQSRAKEFKVTITWSGCARTASVLPEEK